MTRSREISVNLSDEVMDFLDKQTELLGVNRNSLIRMYLTLAMKKNQQMIRLLEIMDMEDNAHQNP